MAAEEEAAGEVAEAVVDFAEAEVAAGIEAVVVDIVVATVPVTAARTA